MCVRTLARVLGRGVGGREGVVFVFWEFVCVGLGFASVFLVKGGVWIGLV